MKNVFEVFLLCIFCTTFTADRRGEDYNTEGVVVKIYGGVSKRYSCWYGGSLLIVDAWLIVDASQAIRAGFIALDASSCISIRAGFIAFDPVIFERTFLENISTYLFGLRSTRWGRNHVKPNINYSIQRDVTGNDNSCRRKVLYLTPRVIL
jgi:hypothetical protein